MNCLVRRRVLFEHFDLAYNFSGGNSLQSIVKIDFSEPWKYMPDNGVGSRWIENVTGNMIYQNPSPGGERYAIPADQLSLIMDFGANQGLQSLPYPDTNDPDMQRDLASHSASCGIVLPFLDIQSKEWQAVLLARINDPWANQAAVFPVTGGILRAYLSFDFLVSPPS